MEKEKKRDVKIFGIDVWRILSYFIIFCVLGFILETVYAFITKGTIESRKGFLYGPVCPIYGLGAVIMIICLQHFKKNNFTIFLGGFLVGSITEYMISFICEYVFNVKWWDYSYMFLNLNGRISLIYSMFWGVLAVVLERYLLPYTDIVIDKLETNLGKKKFKGVTAILIIFLLLDGVITCFALRIFSDRLIYTYDIDVADKSKYIEEYERLMSNQFVKTVADRAFSDEKMLRTFPNLKINQKDGSQVYVSSLITTITPYYYNFNTSGKDFMQKLHKLGKEIFNMNDDIIE